jgi:hypothetical protein
VRKAAAPSTRGAHGCPRTRSHWSCSPELDWQALKTNWFAALERTGVVVEAKPVTRDELPDWLAERLARNKQRASVETLEWLADRVEGNLLAARQEVEKLALLLPEGEITLAAIREAVTDVSRFERDTLLEAIHSDDMGRVARAPRFAQGRRRAAAASPLDARGRIARPDGDCRGRASQALPSARSPASGHANRPAP